MSLTVKGQKMTQSQHNYASQILSIGQTLKANTTACTAAIYAAIWESGMGDSTAWNSKGYGGVLAGNVSAFGHFGPPGSDAVTDAEANLFFKGGSGYQAGGAIALSATVTNPIEIAVRVEVPSIWPSNAYAQENGYIGDTAALAEASAIVQSLGGGAVGGGAIGAGGGGTSNLAALTGAAFTIGGTANQDEDYWTGINRLANTAQWYCFSDGEILYVADGTKLMQQTPVLVVNRFADDVLALDFTWDNTAFQYFAHRKRRTKVQHKATLAKVTSPVEATLALICDIDAVRAGDVIYLLGTGVGDGPWLVGDCRRSVFQVYSEITLVQAMQPINAVSSSTNQLNRTPSNSKNYVNPVGSWTPSRVDAGVDGTLASAYVAPGDSTILVANAHDPGWKNGGYIAGQFTDGKFSGNVWYVAEGIRPTVSVGDKLKAGQPVCSLVASPYNNIVGNIETGWASTSSPKVPLGFVGNSNDQGPIALTYGSSFNRFLKSVGAATGTVETQFTPVPIQGNYP